jgi:hypothetical protein
MPRTKQTANLVERLQFLSSFCHLESNPLLIISIRSALLVLALEGESMLCLLLMRACSASSSCLHRLLIHLNVLNMHHPHLEEQLSPYNPPAQHLSRFASCGCRNPPSRPPCSSPPSLFVSGVCVLLSPSRPRAPPPLSPFQLNTPFIFKY